MHIDEAAFEEDFHKEWYPVVALDSGGGGTVYKCVKKSLLNDAAATIRVAPEEIREQISAALVDSLFKHLIVQGDAVSAVKLPHKTTPLKRFQREIEAMKSCQHPAFIQLFNHGTTDKLSWFAMQYHPNGNLSEHVSSYEKRPLETLLAIRPVVHAVAELHRAGFIHRDIKPKNIFVSSGKELVLGDLGVVFPLSGEDERITEVGNPPISRDWIPDWFRFSDDAPAQKVDVFMLAKVMYYMVRGKNVVASQLTKPSYNLDILMPDVSGIRQFQTFLTKCIVVDEDVCEAANGTELLWLIDNLIADITDKARTQMLFNWASTHSYTDVPIRQVGSDGPNYFSFRDHLVHFPFACKRLLLRVKIQGTNKVCISLTIGERRLPQFTWANPNSQRSTWSDEISYDLTVPIERGWHSTKISVNSDQGGILSGVVLCAE